jgi:hypothetical protein
MRAKLKRLYSPDIDDLENWSPGDESFGFALEAMIGRVDSDGEESFSMTVCTPEWFAANEMKGQTIRSGVQTLFITHYDYRALKAFIERAVHRAEAENWQALAEKLAWLGYWEFADYRPWASN